MRILLAVACCICFLCTVFQDVAQGAKPPNIILILTDDQGYGDLACHGHPYLKTPNLDRLYAQSTRLTDYHVSPTCSPTRSALMSGRAPFKNGVTHTVLERERMTLKATTIAEVLKKAGYTTGIFGKWHLGDEEPYQPHNRGFDEVFIHGAGGIGQAYPGSLADAPNNKYFDPTIRHNGKFVKTRGYCTDVFFKQAMGWISKNRAKPFFAYISTNAPHKPFICPKEYQKKYAKKSRKSGTASFYGMITNIDDNVGRLVEQLDQWGLDKNTLLVFMTDNGSSAGDFNAGMKGKKGSVDEGGSRVPAFFRWPGHFEAGRDVDELTRHVDIFPTFAELAGVKLPADYALDGRSLIPLLTGAKTAWPDRNTFFHKGRWSKKGAPGKWGQGNTNPDAFKDQHFAVRNARWRLVGRKSLYDIEKDPGQKHNVIQDHPEVAAKMLAAYDVWWKEVRPLMINENVPLPKSRPYWNLFKKQQAETGIPVWVEPKLLQPRTPARF